MDETSQPIELLLTVTRNAPETLGTQIERRLRDAIRDGSLRTGARMPSTRDLARQLGVSRRVVTDAYAQLEAEGYLDVHERARPQVAAGVAVAAEPDEPAELPPARPPRYDFRPSIPDVSTFPRTAWLRSVREALAAMEDADLSYGSPGGTDRLRTVLAEYLGRVRGVVATPARLVVTSGYTQGLGIVCQSLAACGASRVALEDPGDPDGRTVILRAGLAPVPIPVDADGIRVDALARSGADAVVLTPAHQHPTGVVMSGERRNALLTWLRAADAIAIEDDYDAEFRYDRAAVGALQGRDPARVVFAGTASKTLAPALRLGWLVVPERLAEPVLQAKLLADRGTARIEQLAFADFLVRGGLDRHLRQMRTTYRARRRTLVDALGAELPDARVRGIEAGLHATVELPGGHDEAAIRAAAAGRRIVIETLRDYRLSGAAGPPTLLLGYGRMPAAAIRAGVREIAAVVRAA
jgi:GntR family transcriptional regulator / MocR family aminotransferase